MADITAKAHAEWRKQRIVCQKEIDASITANANKFAYLHNKPYEDQKKVRVGV